MKDKILGALALLLIIAGMLWAAYVENHYEVKGKITDANTITDEYGQIWKCDTDAFQVGDKVVVHFYNNGTDATRKDDIIQEVNYDN